MTKQGSHRNRCFSWLIMSALLASSFGCFAPRSPDEEPEASFELSVAAGENPKELRWSWTLPPSLRESVEQYRLEWDPDGGQNFESVPGLDAIPSARTEISWLASLHLIPWATARWRIVGLDGSDNLVSISEAQVVSGDSVVAQATGYFKASNASAGKQFSASLAVSRDGKTLAVGDPFEDSGSSGINGEQQNSDVEGSGAVYVFREVNGEWVQDAYVKASNPSDPGSFGDFVALSSDGSTLAVGAIFERSLSRGIDSDQTPVSAFNIGAVYLFERSDVGWAQTAYLKPSNTRDGWDFFFGSVTLSDDGRTLAVGAAGEPAPSSGVNQEQEDIGANRSGAVYVFVRQGETWIQEAYIKASNPDADDEFGLSTSLSGDGLTLAVGASGESSSGIEAGPGNNDADGAGAVYVFRKTDGEWTQAAYLKASNAEAGDLFGLNVSLSGDGEALVVGSDDDSGSFQINGDENDNSAESSGAAYVFVESGGQWVQAAYLKASNGRSGDLFGRSVSLNSDGDVLVVGAFAQNGGTTGVDGDRANNDVEDSGAAYVFRRIGSSWREDNFVKASNTGLGDVFGGSVALSGSGEILAVGAVREDSAATGINGNQEDDSLDGAGAVYLY